MAELKGRYVAQIEVDFEYDGQRTSYRRVHDRIHGEWIDNAIKDQIRKIFVSDNREPKIIVTKQYADVTELQEEE